MNTKKKQTSYACSKRVNRYFTWALGQRLAGVKAVSCHPGYTGSSLVGKATGLTEGIGVSEAVRKGKKRKRKLKKTKTKTKTKLQKNKNKKTSNITGNNIPYMSICRIYIPGAHRNMASTLARVCVLRHPYSWGPNICNTVTRKVPWYLL